MKKSTTKKSPAKSATLATPAALAAETVRANALAKKYGGAAELLTLAEASALHPELALTAADLADTRYFHLRFRPCSICGRFPARATLHLDLHKSGRLDAAGHRTDPEGRAAIAVRVAKAIATIKGEKVPATKKAKAKKSA